MNRIILIAAAALISAVSFAKQPEKIIFDTDLGNDVDDALALDMLNKYIDEGTIDLLAVMTNKYTDYTPTLVDKMNTWYGHGSIPIGKVHNGWKNKDNFEKKVCLETIGGGKHMFKATAASPDEYPDATALYRKILSQQPDHSVIIVSVGYLSNLANLLESKPDEYSKLSGAKLMKKKVKFISLMGGDFRDNARPEFNIKCDLQASQRFFPACPVPVYISPFDLGYDIRYPASSITGDFNWGVNHPVVECYIHYMKMPYDRQTWDLTSTLYAVEPQYFSVSEPGDVAVDEKGVTTFTPSKKGVYRILSTDKEQQARILARFIELVTRMPANLEDPQKKMEPTSYSYLMATAAKEDIKAWYNCSTRIDSAAVEARGKQIKAQKKLICFDLDATLCPHKSPVPAANIAVLDSLAKHYDLAMVGAGNAPRIYNQMGQYPINIVGNYGMETYRMIDGRLTIVQQLKCPADTAEFVEKCTKLRQEHGFTQYYGDPIEFQASGMVTFGLLGTKAESSLKLAFDPDKSKRRAFYPEVVSMFPDYTVFIGGSTSFDFVRKQFNKYDAALKYAQKLGYTKDQVLFVGDDFTDGGGDSHIRLGGIDYIQIYDYNKIPEKLGFLYK